MSRFITNIEKELLFVGLTVVLGATAHAAGAFIIYNASGAPLQKQQHALCLADAAQQNSEQKQHDNEQPANLSIADNGEEHNEGVRGYCDGQLDNICIKESETVEDVNHADVDSHHVERQSVPKGQQDPCVAAYNNQLLETRIVQTEQQLSNKIVQIAQQLTTIEQQLANCGGDTKQLRQDLNRYIQELVQLRQAIALQGQKNVLSNEHCEASVEHISQQLNCKIIQLEKQLATIEQQLINNNGNADQMRQTVTQRTQELITLKQELVQRAQELTEFKQVHAQLSQVLDQLKLEYVQRITRCEANGERLLEENKSLNAKIKYMLLAGVGLAAVTAAGGIVLYTALSQ